MNEHTELPFELILDWLEGRLEPGAARSVESQVETASPETQQTVAFLRHWLSSSRMAQTPALPARVREQLMERFGADRPGFIERFTAALKFDSHHQWAAAGVRSAGMDDRQRQLVYDTGWAEISLNVQPRPQDGRFSLIGQIFLKTSLPVSVPPLEDFSVQLITDSQETGQIQESYSQVDELGEFVFEGLDGGNYDLVLSTGEFETEITAIDL